MGKLNEFNRDEINMVLQKLLQNIQLDPLPQPQPLYSAQYGQSSIRESYSGNYNCRGNLQGKHSKDTTRACFAPGRGEQHETKEWDSSYNPRMLMQLS